MKLQFLQPALDFFQPLQKRAIEGFVRNRFLRMIFISAFVIEPDKAQFINDDLNDQGVDLSQFIGKAVNQRRITQQIDRSGDAP